MFASVLLPKAEVGMQMWCLVDLLMIVLGCAGLVVIGLITFFGDDPVANCCSGGGMAFSFPFVEGWAWIESSIVC